MSKAWQCSNDGEWDVITEVVFADSRGKAKTYFKNMETFDWNELFDRLYLELLDYEHRWHMTEESYNKKLLHNEKIYMDKLRELGAVNEDGSVDITYESGK